MIPYRDCEIIASVLYFFAIKILCYITEIYRDMYKRQPTLTSIPERNENEEEIMSKKWVPKKKHEVLKAKYKCLKKLFQIYDASMAGILPEQYPDIEAERNEMKIRSRRTKTDACVVEAELPSGDVSKTNSDNESVGTAVIRELKMTQCSSTFIGKSKITKFDKHVNTQAIDNLTVFDKECECHQHIEPQHPIPYLEVNERRRPTRLQIFMQRLFGIRREKVYRDYGLPDGHIYASSDNNISYSFLERRPRRGLRFRKLRKPKKIQSDGALKNLKSPVILSYVQSVQRRCLTDRTPRQCPIMGCGMIFYGIINYNDHLNLCHFAGRKYICHYCHEGFEGEYEKFYHENEHIGISKLCKNITVLSPSKDSSKKASNTQTDPDLNKCDVPEEKLKKIVSFFDKIGDTEKIISEIKNNGHFETPLSTETGNSSDSDNRTVSCVNLLHRKVGGWNVSSSADSEVTSKNTFYKALTCNICGENFDSRRQLGLHVDLEHRVQDKFTKFHSCAGIVNCREPKRMDMISEDGKIKVQSVDRSKTTLLTRSDNSSNYTESIRSGMRSDDSLTCDRTTNVVPYYTSAESVEKSSLGKSGHRYKWEPGTKIIRV